MKMNDMLIEDFGSKHVTEAIEIAMKELNRERECCPVLPGEGSRERLAGLIQDICGQPYGKAAMIGGKVVGFLAFFGPWDGFHGKEKGVFSPLGGSAFDEEDRTGIGREKVASMLFAAVADELVRDGIFGCAISRYVHDEEVGRAFVRNGFGIRCSDAILGLAEETNVENEKRISGESGKNPEKSKEKKQQEIKYEELRQEDFKEITSLKMGLILHMSKAPILFPTNLDTYEEWFGKNMRVFVAKIGGEIAGFISVEEEGENFITGDDGMENICGAFFREEFRGNGMAEGLLSYVCDIYRREGKERMGVDYETLNPTALRFWEKYFMPYTYSYARRFDERMMEYTRWLEGWCMGTDREQV